MKSHPRTITSFWIFIAFVIALTGPASEAYAQKRATSVGQVNGTPSGTPRSVVRLEAGLSLSPGNSVGYWTCHSGPVKLYYASGSKWVYVGQANAMGCSGTPNSYATAVFNFRIPANARRGNLRLRYEYPGNNWYSPSAGNGNITVR